MRDGWVEVKNCTGEDVIQGFKSYMKFYYPDWKIYGKPVSKEKSDCNFEIQFTTKNPFLDEKEIIIVEISLYKGKVDFFKVIRGNLY
jgi:hypothetical protein